MNTGIREHLTTAFYAPPSAIRDRRVVLPEDEARHAVRVLRKRVGDEIAVVDGAGGRHRVRLEQVGKRKATGTILDTRREVGEPPYRLTVALALLKNRNRFETFLEKAAELGVHRVVPLQTARTEKKNLRAKRARKILLAAMKQSGRSRLVELAAPQALKAVLTETAGRVLLCHERTGAEASLSGALAGGVPDELCLLVGPAGGFTDGEVEAARAEGAEVVSLGPRRLRAETAAITAAAAVMLAAGG